MHDHSGRATPARPPRRRWRWPHLAALVGALTLALGVAACAGGGKTGGVASLSGSGRPTSTTNANSSEDFRQAALAFARCMRQHGIDMPDPQFSGNRVTQELKAGPGGKGPDDPKFKAAQQACRQYMPNGGQPLKPNAQEQQQMVQFARCMRQHGIAVPDPGPNGGIEVDRGNGRKGPGPDDPKFKAAEQACRQYQPEGGKLQTS
ncbi:MAG TPA: hypothetical protein VEP73_00780, partial [Actinomycetota bacterium]|nr:hypothetical protein [Actinomycetota bacterium]